jgi:hypothetical protein
MVQFIRNAIMREHAMTVLHVYQPKGDPAALMKKYAKLAPKFNDPKYSAGLLAHFVVETEDGIAVYNLMKSPKHMDELLNDPDLGHAIAKAGLASVDVSHGQRTYKVHDFYLKP